MTCHGEQLADTRTTGRRACRESEGDGIKTNNITKMNMMMIVVVVVMVGVDVGSVNASVGIGVWGENTLRKPISSRTVNKNLASRTNNSRWTLRRTWR